jgi:hypothetical protein
VNFNVNELLLDLNIEGIEFYLLRPVQTQISSGDVDIVIYEKFLDAFEGYLKRKHGMVTKLNRRFAFHTTEYIVGDICIDVKHAICFGVRKQIKSKLQLVTKSFNESCGYIYSDEQSFFNLIWYLHLLLDKKDPRDSSTYNLFEHQLYEQRIDLSFVRRISILKNHSEITPNLDKFDEVRSQLVLRMTLKNKFLSSAFMLFIFRLYFYTRRKLFYYEFSKKS